MLLPGLPPGVVAVCGGGGGVGGAGPMGGGAAATYCSKARGWRGRGDQVRCCTVHNRAPPSPGACGTGMCVALCTPLPWQWVPLHTQHPSMSNLKQPWGGQTMLPRLRPKQPRARADMRRPTTQVRQAATHAVQPASPQPAWAHAVSPLQHHHHDALQGRTRTSPGGADNGTRREEETPTLTSTNAPTRSAADARSRSSRNSPMYATVACAAAAALAVLPRTGRATSTSSFYLLLLQASK